MKIAVAMSGGVDSSVAAALMTEKYGQENVFGVTMKLFCYGEGECSDKSCCSLDAIADAAAVCRQLGIRHYVVNLEKEFQREVIDDFVSQYQAGLTPNPCVRCNQTVKYEHLLQKALGLGADKLVTGHYARIADSTYSSSEVEKLKKSSSLLQSNNKIYHLLRGLDSLKDQSYFLYNLTQEQLSFLDFPVGELTKVETRKLARKYSLKTAEKTESQDICFVTDSVQGFLADKITAKTGNIVDSVGEIYGRHNGLHNYTIGQRKGLGGGYSGIMYVIGLNIENNEVVIGPAEALYSDSLRVDNPHWVVDTPKLPFTCKAKIRYASDPADCILSSPSSLVALRTVSDESHGLRVESANPGISDGPSEGDPRFRKDDNRIMVTFTDPQKAITPGQSVVFYDGEEVLGGGVISA